MPARGSHLWERLCSERGRGHGPGFEGAVVDFFEKAGTEGVGDFDDGGDYVFGQGVWH